ncbi:MAG TPA: IclR family transcriptional regulator [Candidatus Limnocylindria bacterium]
MAVLERATRILDEICASAAPLTLTDIARALEEPRSTVHRLLTELVALRLLTRVDGMTYLPGSRLAEWGEVAARALDLATVSPPFLREVRDSTGESVRLYVRDGDSRVCVATVEGTFELRHVAQLGRRLPLRVGAAGKLLLAYASPELQRSELALAVTHPFSSGAVPAAELEGQIEEIRRAGWATSIAEREEGLAAAAVPVHDRTGRVVGALSISGPSSRLSQARLQSVRPILEEAAQRLSGTLGWQQGGDEDPPVRDHDVARCRVPRSRNALTTPRG